MGHKWIYRGEGVYGCEKCGEVADKSNVRDISRQDCPGDAAAAGLAADLSILTAVVDALCNRVKEIEKKQEVHQ
ncbi:hypothetical protein ES705_46286 [subsurface metagenome]